MQTANRKSQIAGFTLLEMIISIGIFSVLVVATIGITIGISNAQIKAQNVQTILDNIRFSLELVTKEMRTGSNWALTSICAPSGSEISFTTALGERRTYFRDDTSRSIRRATETITSGECSGSPKVKPLTSEDVEVERINFSEIRGQAVGPLDGQPRITITLRVKSRSPKYQLESSMDLETTIVQRLRDI